jgi:hypothetical protein
MTLEWCIGQQIFVARTYEGEKSEIEVTIRDSWTSDPCFSLMLQLVGYVLAS